MNIPRYVDTFEQEEERDFANLLDEMSNTEVQISEAQEVFVEMLKNLTSEDESIMSSLNSFIKMIEG